MNFSLLLNVTCCLFVHNNLTMRRLTLLEIMEKLHIFDNYLVLLTIFFWSGSIVLHVKLWGAVL